MLHFVISKLFSLFCVFFSCSSLRISFFFSPMLLFCQWWQYGNPYILVFQWRFAWPNRSKKLREYKCINCKDKSQPAGNLNKLRKERKRCGVGSVAWNQLESEGGTSRKEMISYKHKFLVSHNQKMWSDWKASRPTTTLHWKSFIILEIICAHCQAFYNSTLVWGSFSFFFSFFFFS